MDILLLFDELRSIAQTGLYYTDDPYQPVERFISLVRESDTFRGYNTTHMPQLVLGEFHQEVFD